MRPLHLRYCRSHRHLEETMAERNLSVDHPTVWGWVHRYRPVLASRIKRELKLGSHPRSVMAFETL